MPEHARYTISHRALEERPPQPRQKVIPEILVAKLEERSVAHICELFFRTRTDAYRKAGSKYLQQSMSRQYPDKRELARIWL